MPPERSKHPLAVLQSMINGILIETGKALRASDKESGKTLSHANARLRSTIPSAIDNFHQALDEIEINIIRAKAVLTRDLEELRAKRLAADNLVTGVSQDVTITDNMIATEDIKSVTADTQDLLPEEKPPINDNNGGNPPETLNTNNTGDTGKEILEQIVTSGAENIQPAQTGSLSTVGLGIDTGEKPNDAGQQENDTNDILNELFEMEGNNDNSGNSNLNFDGMDFSLHGPDAANNPAQDQSQLHSHEFDLSTFGDTSQVNNMALDSTHNNGTLDVSNQQAPQSTTSGAQGENTDKQNLGNSIFDLGENANGTDTMNIDFDNNMVGGDDSMFDDLFFNTDDNNMSGSGGNGGEFDDAFFGLDN